MARTQSVVSLDPIDRNNKKRSGPIGRFFKTRHYRGKGMKKTDPFGHYLFVGRQRSGKTVSAIWYYEFLKKRYERFNKRVILYSNMGFGEPITKVTLSDTIKKVNYDPDVVISLVSFGKYDCNSSIIKIYTTSGS